MPPKPGVIKEGDGWKVVFRTPTPAKFEAQLRASTKRALEEFLEACFLEGAMHTLYMPPRPEYGQWEQRQAWSNASADLCDEKNPLHLAYALKVAEAVVADLKVKLAATKKPRLKPKPVRPRKRI